MAPLIVFNPGGRDEPQEFPDGAGRPDDPGAPHPPVNFHAYAACTRGSFLTDPHAIARADPARPVLLLLRRDARGGLHRLRQLRAAGRYVTVSFKETGTSQLAERLSSPAALASALAALREADAVLAPTPELAAFALAAGARRAEFIPTPYPVDDPRWDFGVPAVARRGIWVGTREFGVPARNHLAAVLAAGRLAEETGAHVTVVNAEGRGGARMLATLGFNADPAAPRRFLAPLPYADYLRAMARHRLVFQLDRSGVPGQVAGDALLARVPCVGGDGAVERLAFPDFCGHGRDTGELLILAADLLRPPAPTPAPALESVSFATVAARLAAFFGG